jgi:hypothetical protein
MTDTDPEELAAWLSDVANDPVKFVMTAFEWGTGELANSQGSEPWQLWVLEQIRDGLLKPGEAIKLAIASGHGVGKSALCSWICLWAISTFPDTRGLVTASSESMLNTRFRAELKSWVRRCKIQSFFELTATSLLSRDSNHEQTWRVDLLPWNENRPEAFAGLHNKGCRILVIFDEASAIASSIWETVEAVATDHDAQVIWICCGNPLHPIGRFRDCWERFAHRWITKHVNSLDVSFTNKPQLRRWMEDYGEDSDFVRTRVLGEFPRTASTQFIGPELVQEAMDRELIPSRTDPLVIGVDVARFGDDESVIFPRRGMDARTFKPLTFRNIPLDKLEDQVVAFCNAHRVTQILCDGTGVGGGLCDHLRRRGYLVTDVQFGARADQQIDGTRFANKRAEIWGLMRNALRNLCLPNSQVLKEQLTGPEYSFSRTSDAILLEPKDAMKRRGVPSPDLADALACTFGAEIATLPALSDWVQPHGALSEYDPFSQAAMEGRYADAVIGRPRYYAPPQDGWVEWSKMKPEYE